MSDSPQLDPEAASDEAVPVQQDMAFQRREWTVQRVGWVVMALIVVLALLGLTGRGPLANASESTADDALRLNYARFDRLQSPGSLEIEVATSGADQMSLWLANEFLETVTIEAITPAPVETRIGADRQVFVFAVNPAEETARIQFDFRHDAFGLVSGVVGIVDGPELGLSQFVYP